MSLNLKWYPSEYTAFIDGNKGTLTICVRKVLPGQWVWLRYFDGKQIDESAFCFHSVEAAQKEVDKLGLPELMIDDEE